MINFSELKLNKINEDNFVGIRKSKSEDSFEFCLPNGFNDFPEADFNKVRDLFFKMYRTFRKFERDNQGTNRFQKNEPQCQQEQDQTTLSYGGISIQTQDGESCLLYSKLRMIEQVLEAYDDLAINLIQGKVGRSEEVDYSQIYKYLERAIYLDNDVIYIEAMDLPRLVMRYESTDIVNLYCYILDEIVQQLDGDVSEHIQAHTQDIHFLAQHFKDDYLTSNQSIFDKDTFVTTINILKEVLDKIDKNTYYKDADYWGLYEAIETFLYGELNTEQNDGDFWGIYGFSLVWEDMCHTYFFRNHYHQILYADTDIPLKGYKNDRRQNEEKNRVGNDPLYNESYRNKWIYQQLSNISKKSQKGKFKSWGELFCIEFDINLGKFNGQLDRTSYRESLLLKRFPSPDIVLNINSNLGFFVEIIDYKNVPLEFYKNVTLSPKSAHKYRDDIRKQLTYELALQQTHTVSANKLFIPYYYDLAPKNEPIGEIDPNIDMKGIKVFKANFLLIQKTYLEESL
jgi:hypothetical protein